MNSAGKKQAHAYQTISPLQRALVVAASVFASTLLARALEPYVASQAPLLPFTLAVIVSAWYGGPTAGLAATVLSFLSADYFFLDPKFHLLPFSPAHAVLFLLFFVVGFSISILKTALAQNTLALQATVRKLDQATERYEFAAQYGRIGFQDYIAHDDRQIWTSEMEELFGLEPGTFEGTYDAWVRRIHPDDRETVTRERLDCVQRRQSDWKYEYRAVLPDGTVRWLEGRSRLLFSPSGSLDRIIGATIDITDRRLMEQSLRDQSEQLAKANQELERFAYVVSHDLQEPLRGITTMTELLLRRAGGLLDPESVTIMDFLVKSSHRMKELIRDILDLARSGSQAAGSLADISMAAVLETAIDELKGAVDESQARITVGDMPIVRANPGQLVRLFQNLLGNAIKYRGNAPPEIYVTADLGDEEWIFCVSDNGIGIAPEYQERVFEAFQRISGATHCEGTGLGLAICRRIVQWHGGRLWVESQPQKGSRFYVALPKGFQSLSRQDGVEEDPVLRPPLRRTRTAAT